MVGARKLERLAAVCRAADLTLVADSTAVADGYQEVARQAGRTLRVLIEVDTGMGRVGATPDAAPGLARHLSGCHGLEFHGILTHAGHAHDAEGQLGVERVAREEAAIMGAVRADLEQGRPRGGGGLRGLVADRPLLERGRRRITEIRPGTYVYNDLRTLACWSCTYEEIAATMLATVISVDGTRVVVDAGCKTLTTSTDPVYGQGHLLSRPDSRVHPPVRGAWCAQRGRRPPSPRSATGCASCPCTSASGVTCRPGGLRHPGRDEVRTHPRGRVPAQPVTG